MGLTLEQANTIVGHARAAARRAGFPPMAIVVLDSAGHLICAQREDGASMFRTDIALGKAWGAVAMGASSRSLADRASANPNFYQSLASSAPGPFCPQTGAVLILDEYGMTLGTVGASGGTGDEDEFICLAGVAASGLLSA